MQNLSLQNNVEMLKKLYNICKKSNSNFYIVLVKYFYFKVKGKNIISHQNTIIKGLRNISVKGLLKIGVDYVGFVHNKDITYLNIKGRLEILGNFSISRGCRLDIGKNAVVQIGGGSYINPFTNIIIMHRLSIGKNCAISWNCQFLDEDFHQIQYEEKKENNSLGISIGDSVWIGSNVSIFKGTVIPKGCVVASNTVVKNKFYEENVLIAGNPAKIIKRNVTW
ncbi:acyltransferase [Pontibacter harenae]|uniref:acyltransferase n=1 Tax=Pontibacter harenae TaxID=2894083 RepID=UPI001E4D5393|nr:acyltransferase [Pontibacter harenae]MCC9166595.1 acyltransferase [Pontibacter harenae]